MIHLGARALKEISGEVVQTVSFCFGKSNCANYKKCVLQTFRIWLFFDAGTFKSLIKVNNTGY